MNSGQGTDYRLTDFGTNCLGWPEGKSLFDLDDLRPQFVHQFLHQRLRFS